MEIPTKFVMVMVALTCIMTLYSLSELHSLSVAHADEENIDAASTTGSVGARQLASDDSATSTSTSSQSSSQASLPAHTVNGGRAQQEQQARKADDKSASSAASGAANGVATNSSSSDQRCYLYPNTELWGDVVVWGNANLMDSPEACCDACRNYKPKNADDHKCNVFVYCADKVACKDEYKQCWLKHLVHPAATRPARQGPQVPWTSGTVGVDMMSDPGANKPKAQNSEERRFHIVTSAQGAAVHWQARIHYYWYKKQKAQCEKEGVCEMGGFTRLLHSGQPDDLMGEIPTMVVDPLPSDMVEHSWYIVLNRPYAFVHWVNKAQVPEKYVLMAEPDHIFLRPLPNFMKGDTPAAFPFFYIEPAKKEFVNVTKKFTGPVTTQQLEELAPIGNSPTFMTMTDMKKTMPLWMNISIAIFKDADANKAWGWVQEMYGFSIAAWMAGIKKFDLHLNMMAQPPWDMELKEKGRWFYILHYTYGMDYTLTGEFTPGKIGQWRFDKRSYGGRPIPRHLDDPPKGMKNDLVRALINSFNEATDAIPCWPEYEKSGKVPKECSEPPKHFLAEEAKLKVGKAGNTTSAAVTRA